MAHSTRSRRARSHRVRGNDCTEALAFGGSSFAVGNYGRTRGGRPEHNHATPRTRHTDSDTVLFADLHHRLGNVSSRSANEGHTQRLKILTTAFDDLRVDDADHTAKAVFDQFGSLSAFVRADANTVRNSLAHAPAAADALIAARELIMVGLYESVTRSRLDPLSYELHRYLYLKLRHRPDEVLLAFFVDEDGALLAEETLACGERGSVRTSIRHLLRRALVHDASAMLLVHNHPSGMCEPSCEDLIETKRTSERALLVGVELLDHLVVAKDGVFSINEGQPYDVR